MSRRIQRFPSLAGLEAAARRRLPYFVYDYLQGGTSGETCRDRNAAAFASIEVVPRYAVDVSAPDMSCRFFGTDFCAPIGISPIGSDGAIWPGGARHLAKAAQALSVSHSLSSMSNMSIADAVAIGGDRSWFQLYGFAENDHALSFKLIERAKSAGSRVLVVTLDVPAPSRRVRDMGNGLGVPLRLSPRMIAGMLGRPAWLLETIRKGVPQHAVIADQLRPGAPKHEVDSFIARSGPGRGVDWQVLARFREAWSGPMLVKGILHPADALRARALGIDGVVVSNHGGRQFDAAPASIDVLPAIRAAVADDMFVALDSGVMSGNDVFKALALGADLVMVGRALMLGLAALGAGGARHVLDTLISELRAAMGQAGTTDLAAIRSLAVRHPGAWRLEDFGDLSGSDQ